MIQKIEISNFKSIDKLEMNCKKLNLLTGINSSGKSTIQQAILFAGQNVEEKNGLNGPFVKLGGFEENQCLYSADKEIIVKLYDQKENYITRELKREEDGKLHLTSRHVGDLQLLDMLSIRRRKLQFLSCHRIGPQNLYGKNTTMEDLIGIDGEFAISYLSDHAADCLSEKLCRGTVDYTLYGQVNWWLSYITGARIHTEEIPGADSVKASYQMYEVKGIRPSNIGSGISYLISILIMCLSSPPKAILVIENPEIHLHPTAQAKVCEFFYFIAKSGRQLFVETHSDHIFNGFRAGIASKEMEKNLINIEFVYMNERFTTEIMEVEIGRYGKVVNQRKDLFDQFDLDLNRMIGL